MIMVGIHTTALAIGCLLAFNAQAQNTGPQSWCKSKYGPDDQIGAANLLTPELTLNAAKLVKTGKTYSLGTETNAKTPAFGPRSWALVITQPGQVGGAGLGPTKTNYNDDVYMGYVGTGTQIDGLGHIGIDNVYYNCHRNSDFVQANGLIKLGIEKIPNIVTRGVLLDMAAHYGTDLVPEGTAFNRKQIDDVAAKQGVEIRKGDVVILGSKGRSIWPVRRWLRSALTAGVLRRSRSSRGRVSSRCTRLSSPRTASTFLRTSTRPSWPVIGRMSSCLYSAIRASQAECKPSSTPRRSAELSGTS
jgi:hypothetical protein